MRAFRAFSPFVAFLALVSAASADCPEPSALDQRPAARPLTLQRAAGALELQWEATGTQFGVFEGDLHALRAQGLAPRIVSSGASPVAIVAPAPRATFYLVAGSCDGGWSSLGRDSFGGERLHGEGCTACVGQPVGIGVGDCAQELELPTAWKGEVAFEPWTLRADRECQVRVVTLGAEWCFWCRLNTEPLVALHDLHAADGDLAILDMLYEDVSHAPADEAAVRRWIADLGIPYFVAAEPTMGPFMDWFDPACGAFPQTIVIGRDDVVSDRFCGRDDTGITAAVERELDR